MKKFRIYSFITVFALLFTTISFSANEVTNENKIEYSKNQFSMQSIESKTKEFLLERANIVNFENAVTYNISSFYQPTSKNDQEIALRDSINDYAEMLQSVDLHYINPRISLEFTGLNEISNTKIELQAMETILMEIEGHGTDRGYSIEHNFIYQKIGDEWKLIEDQILSPYGMVKDQNAYDFVNENSPYYNQNKEISEEAPIGVSSNL